MLPKSVKKSTPYRPFHVAIEEKLMIPEKCWPFLYLNSTRAVLQFSSTSPRLYDGYRSLLYVYKWT